MKKILGFVASCLMMTSIGASANTGWGDLTDGGKQPTFYANTQSGIHGDCFAAPAAPQTTAKLATYDSVTGKVKSLPTFPAVMTKVSGSMTGPTPSAISLSTPVVGVGQTITALAKGHLYQITSVGSSNYILVGAKYNEIGETFYATSSGSATGTGTLLDLTNCDSGPALRKFVDTMPTLVPTSTSNTGDSYIPIASPKKWVRSDGVQTNDDYYEIAVVQYRHRYHSDMLGNGSVARSYVQIDPYCTDTMTPSPLTGDVNSGAFSAGISKCVALLDDQSKPVMIARPMADGRGGFALKQAYGVDNPLYGGPVIIASHGVASRIKFYNALPVGRADANGRNGDIPLPTDTTLSGAGFGPDGVVKFTQNRSHIHLHGGDNPWIGDGHPHQWMTPAGESGQFGNLSGGAVYAKPWSAGLYLYPNEYVTYQGVWYQNQTANPITTAATAPTHITGTTNSLTFVNYTCNIAGVNTVACDVAKYNFGSVASAGYTGTAAATKIVTDGYLRGVTNKLVPDMSDPGPGSTTYYYPNGLTARSLWYHDHAFGATRLNVYLGEASMYLLQDDNDGHNNPSSSMYFPINRDIPLILQDKSFIPLDITRQDARWDGAINGWGQPGDLWYPHVYETNQNPSASDNTNPIGRWDWAQWMSPPTLTFYSRLPTGEHVTLTATNALTGTDGKSELFVNSWAYNNPQGLAGTPLANGQPTPTVSKLDEVTLTPEAWMDTGIVNGKAYPAMTVEPDRYRFRALNGANDRMFNLGLYIAADRYSYAQVSPFDKPVVNNPAMCYGEPLDANNSNLAVISGNSVVSDGSSYDLPITDVQQYVIGGNYYLGTNPGYVVPSVYQGAGGMTVRAWSDGSQVLTGQEIEYQGHMYQVTAPGTLTTPVAIGPDGTLTTAGNAVMAKEARGWVANSVTDTTDAVYSKGNIFKVTSVSLGVNEVDVQYGGKGYKSAVVNFSAGCTVQPTAVANLSGGRVVSVDILTQGSGCPSAMTATVVPATNAVYTAARLVVYTGQQLGPVPPSDPSDQTVMIQTAGTIRTFNTARTIPLKNGDPVMFTTDQLATLNATTPLTIYKNTAVYVSGYTPTGTSSIFALAMTQADALNGTNTVTLNYDPSNNTPVMLANVVQRNGSALLTFAKALEFNTSGTPDPTLGTLKYLTNYKNCTEVLESDASSLTYWPTTGGLKGTGWGAKSTQSLFWSPVPSSDYLGPDINMIMNEGGMLPAVANIPSTPLNWESNVKNAVFLNVAEIGWFLPPAVRSDGVVDFSNYRGATLIMYNNAPAPLPAPDVRLSYYTGMGDQSASGGGEDVMAGYGPSTRTLIQLYVNSDSSLAYPVPAVGTTPSSVDAMVTQLGTEVQNYYNANQQSPVVPLGTQGSNTTGGYMTPTATANVYAYTPLSYASQNNIGWPSAPVKVGDLVKDKNNHLYSVVTAGTLGTDTSTANTAICGTANYCLSNTVILGNGPYKYTGSPTCTANTTLATPNPCATPASVALPGNGSVIGSYVDSKTIFETFDATWGRMNALLGIEFPPQGNVLVNTTVPLGYIDPATENVSDGNVYIWRIVHNGVDSHPVHFHLYDVQILNRIGIDGMNHPITAEEAGWKETVLLSPLTTSFIAIRVRTPGIPFGLPQSVRMMDPSQATGSANGFTLIDPTTGAAPVTPIVNASANYGFEYVWHCHILGHEENDFMRPVVFSVGTVVVPNAPTGLVFSSGNTLAWTDATPGPTALSANLMTYYSTLTNEQSFTVARTVTPANASLPNKTVILPANVTSYTDPDLAGFISANASTELKVSLAVSAQNSAGTSAAVSAVKVANIKQPTIVTVGNPSATSVAVTYTDQSAIETGFNVYYQQIVGSTLTGPIVKGTCTAVPGAIAAGASATCTLNYASNTGLVTGNYYVFGVTSISTDNSSVGYSESLVTWENTAPNSGHQIPVPQVASLASNTVTSTSFKLTWTNPPGATGSVNLVCLGTNTTCTPVNPVGSTVTNGAGTATITGLAPNTTYNVGVTPSGAGATSTSFVSVTTLPIADAAPTVVPPANSTLCTATACTATVNWVNQSANSANTSSTTNVVRTQTLPTAGAATTIATGLASSVATYQDTTAVPGNTYTYQVVAVGSTGLTANSPVSVATLMPSVITVTNLSVSAITTNSATVGWANPATGNNTKNIVYCATATCTAGLSGGVGTPTTAASAVAAANTSQAITGLTANTSYYFGVQVVSGTQPILSSAATYTLPAAATAVTSTLGACTSNTACNVTVGWTNGNTGTTTATVTRVVTGTTTPVTTIGAGITTSTVTDATALPGTSYTYSVQLTGPGGVSAVVAGAAATTPTAPITGLTSTLGATPTTAVTLTWTNPSTTVQGAIVRSCSGASTCTGTAAGTKAIAVTGTAATATITGLTPNTTYYFDVQAAGGAVVTTSITTAPAAVTGLAQAVVANCTSATVCPITLNWTNPNGGTSTIIVTRTPTGSTTSTTVTNTLVGTASGTVTDNTAVPGATYTYTVQVSSGATSTGTLSAAASLTAVKAGNFVGPATGVTITKVGTTITMSWVNNSTGVAKYVVQWAPSASAGTIFANNTSNLVTSAVLSGAYTVGGTIRATFSSTAINAGAAGTYQFRVIPVVGVATQAIGTASTPVSITY